MNQTTISKVKENNLIITFDTDWCPDFVIEHVRDLLIKSNIKSTWFVTNESKAVQTLKKNRLFEVGIHPNFLTNSTHGNDFNSIMTHMKRIVPNAKSIRTHALVESTLMLTQYKNYGIQNDSTYLLMGKKNIEPHYDSYFGITRMPMYWIDQIALHLNNFKIELNSSGFKVLDFHPIYIYLNSRNTESYEEIKGSLSTMNEKQLESLVNKDSFGIGNLFIDTIRQLKESTTLGEACESWRAENSG